MSESFIQSGPDGGILFSGREAVEVYQAIALRSALRLLEAGIKPGRGWTLGKALIRATSITGVEYKGKKDIERAREDLRAWYMAQRESLVRAPE
jgi:hypothetical protein